MVDRKKLNITKSGEYPKWLDPEYSGVQIPASMSHRAAKFCQEYIANGGNGSSAARAAGYSANSSAPAATRLLKDPRVITYIADMRGASTSRAIMNRVERMELLSRIGRGAIEGSKVDQQLRAIELLGKMEGDFTEKVDNVTRIVVDRGDGSNSNEIPDTEVGMIDDKYTSELGCIDSIVVERVIEPKGDEND